MSVIKRLSLSYYMFTKVERNLSKKIIQQPTVIMENPIAHAAKVYGVSISSIQRIAKKIGFSGYSEFRFSLSNDFKKIEPEKLSTSNPISQIIDGYKEQVELLRHEDYYRSSQHIKEMIIGANNLYIVGLGSSFYAAGYLEHKLFYGTRSTHVINEQERFDYLDGIIKEHDVVVIFSVSGAESILKKYKKNSFKRKGARLILITMNADTSAKSMVDYMVVLPRAPFVVKDKKESGILIDDCSIYIMYINIILFVMRSENLT